MALRIKELCKEKHITMAEIAERFESPGSATLIFHKKNRKTTRIKGSRKLVSIQ